MTTLEIGANYRLTTKSGNTRDVTIVGHNAVDRRFLAKVLHGNAKGTQAIRLSDFASHRKIRACAARSPIDKRTEKRAPLNTQLYIFQLDKGTYKIGCSDDVEERLRTARTWCANLQKKATRKIPVSKSANWRTYEHKLHAKFARQRCANGGTEVFRLTAAQANEAIEYLRRMRFE